MKSNQERSNECLPPKKRDFPVSTLPSEDRPVVMAPASESQRGENLAWLASVASGHDSGGQQHRYSGSSAEPDGPQYKPLPAPPAEYSSSISSSSSYSTSSYSTPSYSTPSYSTPSYSSSSYSSRGQLAVTTLPAVYTSTLSQPGGAIQYTPLPHNLHFISSPYAGPYAGYISSTLAPPPPAASPAQQPRSHAEAYVTNSSSSQASKLDQQHHQLSRLPGLAVSDDGPPPHSHSHSHSHAAQYIQIAAGSPLSVTPRTAPSPHAHLPLHLHPHHTLALGGSSQLLVQYSDSGPAPKKEDAPSTPGARPRELLNGELEKGRRFGASPDCGPGGKLQGGMAPVKAVPSSSSSSHQHHLLHQQQQQSPHHYEARHVVLPVDYATDAGGLRTSLVLVPNSHSPGGGADPGGSLDKTRHGEKGGICMGKPMSRPPSSSSSLAFLPPLGVDGLKGAVTTLPPHTVIQTTHNVTESLSLGLPSTNFYPAQPPIIGYIAGAGPQPSLGYHTGLSQHLVIPAQPVIIPVSGAGGAGLEAHGHAAISASPPFSAALSHAFVTSAAPKAEPFEPPAPYPHPTGTVLQAQLHLPVIPAPAGLLASPPPPPSAPSLPPYFVKGSIIQLADGELKRVEDLKTEDFIQSAEISSELKIDSSTVERIDGSHTPNYAIIQFAVGEHRSQVSVEVLVEYPFFVFGQGWSSCCPERTTQLLELPCAKLSVGDVCISLTLKNLKNGSLKKSQALEPPGIFTPPLKPPRVGSAVGRGGGRHAVEQENGLGVQGRDGRQGGGGGSGQANAAENGELRFGGEREACKAPPPPPSDSSEPGSRPAGRKRRWSAPEGRKVEKPDEEPPLTLPKPSFIPQEVKISIEGRSNIGK